MYRKSILAVILTISFVLGLCGCGNGDRKTRANEEQMQTLMIEYVREKYNFEPKVISFYRNTVFNNVNDYLTVSDGNEEFTVWANQYSELSDNYEIDDIEADLAEWMDSQIPGVYSVRLNSLRMLTLDQKYDGTGFAFLKANNESFDFTAVYVNRYFIGTAAVDYVRELANSYNWRYDVCFLNCPNSHSAEEMSKHSMQNFGLEADKYEPYILQTVCGSSSRSPELKNYSVEQAGTMLYTRTFEGDSEVIACSIEPADRSVSTIAPTYHIEYQGGSGMANFVIYIPMSDINFDFEEYKKNNPDRTVVHKLFGFTSDSEGSFENYTKSYTEMCGEYIRVNVSVRSGEYDFTLGAY